MNDTKMQVRLAEGVVLEIWHKSEMGNLTSLWHQVARRSARSRTPDLYNWLSSARTQKLIAAYRELNSVDKIVETRGRGRASATWAHLDLIISAMAYLDPDVEAKVVHEFVRNRVLAWRDDSGEWFKDLNAMVKLRAEEVLGKPAHRGHYITLAKTIKKRCGVADWDLAKAEQLHGRTRIEEVLSAMLRAGVVRDWDHLKELAEKV